MKLSCLFFCCFAALGTIPSWGWLGIKTKSAPASQPSRENPYSPDAVGKAANATKADTNYLTRKVLTIPIGAQGAYMGTLYGVRCFNCTPDMVQLNLGDSLSGETGILALRIEVWNAIERPVRDRRMYDYHNRCFYFGHKEVDTAFVGGEWTEIRVRELPCYPYMQRSNPPKVVSIPAPTLRDSTAAVSTAPAAARSAVTAASPVAVPDSKPAAQAPANPKAAPNSLIPLVEPISAPERSAPSVLRSDVFEEELIH